MFILDELLKTDCVKFGKFQLKSGEISKYYFDMKGLILHPELLASIGDKIYKEFIENRVFNVIYFVEFLWGATCI